MTAVPGIDYKSMTLLGPPTSQKDVGEATLKPLMQEVANALKKLSDRIKRTGRSITSKTPSSPKKYL